MKKIGTPLLLSALFLFISCSVTKEECEEACTEEFNVISVEVTNQDGQPVALDTYMVLDAGNGRDFTIELTDPVIEAMRATGTYQLFSDKHVSELSGQQVELIFKGFINSREIINEFYTIRIDCCHVHHISGDLQLVVDLEQ